MIEFSTQVLGATPRVGRHRLSGIITVDGAPAKRPVYIFNRATLAVVAATHSSPETGAWEIYGLAEYPERALLAVTLDTTGNYNAEVADYISQVATYTPSVEE